MARVPIPVIVIIDDDPIILKTILNILRPYYDVHPFLSGETALQYLTASWVDLVLLDFKMPEMDGLEVADRLQRNAATQDIPILFLAATDHGDGEMLTLEKNASDYLRKPITPQALLARVRHQLEFRQYRKRLEALVEEKTEHLTQALNRLKCREDTTLSMLAMATDLRDHNTGKHIWRTTELVRLITQWLMENPKDGYLLTPEQASDITKSSKLHDLGKIAIPDHILRKPGKLTDEEFEIIKQHPLHGANFLEEFIDPLDDDAFLSIAQDIILYHHEKWDGSGYPTGRGRDKIPLSARIVAIADVYDALVSFRHYKEAFSYEKSFALIADDRGLHFDPHLVDVFIACADMIPAVYRQDAPAARYP